MKVSELINALQYLDKDTEVMISDDWGTKMYKPRTATEKRVYNFGLCEYKEASTDDQIEKSINVVVID